MKDAEKIERLQTKLKISAGNTEIRKVILTLTLDYPTEQLLVYKRFYI